MINLFEPTKIGTMELKNHFFRSATLEGKATLDGHMTKDLLNVYQELAEGGIGAIITSYTYICSEERSAANQMGIYDDSFIEDYKKVTEIIHNHDTKAIMQIVYGGSLSQGDPEHAKVLGPSAIKHPTSGITPKEMDKQDIDNVIKLFADAARRAKASGFDGVQLHVAHGYLLSQFISPLFNHREDEYGGSVENRFRFVREVYEAVRKVVGDDYSVWVKINSSDEVEGGLTTEDSYQMCKWLSDLGVDAIEISGNLWRMHPAHAPEGAYYKEYAIELANAITTPVLLTGGNRDLEEMQWLANNSNVKFFGFARPLMKNPSYVKMLQE